MILRDYISRAIVQIVEKHGKVNEIEFDLNVSPAQYLENGKKVEEIIVIGEGNPNHSRIKFKVNC